MRVSKHFCASYLTRFSNNLPMLVGLMNLVFILSHPINIQIREPNFGDFAWKKTNNNNKNKPPKHSLAFRYLQTTFFSTWHGVRTTKPTFQASWTDLDLPSRSQRYDTAKTSALVFSQISISIWGKLTMVHDLLFF